MELAELIDFPIDILICLLNCFFILKKAYKNFSHIHLYIFVSFVTIVLQERYALGNIWR